MVEYFRTLKVKKNEDWYTFTAAFLKIIEYPMKANRLNKAQWEQVLKTFLHIGLKKTGIVRTFPRVMVYISEKSTRTGSEPSLVQ